MSDNLHANVGVIQKMETVYERFVQVVVDRLPSVASELRQVTEELDERRTDLRREISALRDAVSNAEEEEDVSWSERRIEDAEEELASVQRRIRQLSETAADYIAGAEKVEELATDSAVRARDFLRGVVDDLRAYFALHVD